MKANIFYKYGSLDVLKFEDIEKPIPKDNEVLIKIHASSVNFGNIAHIKGKPFLARFWTGLLKPRHKIPGGDVAGHIESVGKDVKQFLAGDEVFGDLADCGFGTYAEYVCTLEGKLAPKPFNISFEEAAGSAQAAVVALQGLRVIGQIKAGQKVLIYGASGGIGSFAVQLAKLHGAEVTGVCSTRNIEMVRSIGADYVIDYTKEDFSQQGHQYDLIISTAGFRSIFDYKRVLCPKGIYVTTGGSLKQIFQAMLIGPLISMFGKKKFYNLLHKINQKDLFVIKDFFESGNLTTVIDKKYNINDVIKALEYYTEGHSSGKVIITMTSEK